MRPAGDRRDSVTAPSVDRRSIEAQAAAAPRQAEAPFVLRDARGSPYLVPRALRIINLHHEPTYLPLDPHLAYTFGRSNDVNVFLDADSVSRVHGRLSYREDGRWTYRDLGSSNGTYLSEYIDPDEEESARKLEAGKEHVVAAAQTLLFAKAAVRITLLPSIPKHAALAQAAVSRAARTLEGEVQDHAPHGLPLFLIGPTGSGKTWLAKRIHALSGRQGQFVLVNCGRLPRDLALLHSELLGHVKGAFSGAVTPRQGRIHAAEGGTLFLDEVESMPREAQEFLLDLLDGSGQFAPLGARPTDVYAKPDFRLLSGSKVPLAESGLRQDLCFRLAHGGVIRLPSLEERQEDIPTLIRTFLQELKEQRHVDAELTPEALQRLVTTPWPGHIRELRSVVETLVSVASNRQRARRLERQQQTSAILTLAQVEAAREAQQSERVLVSLDQVEETLRARQAGLGAFAPARPPGFLPQQTQQVDLARVREHAAAVEATSAASGAQPAVRGKRPEHLTADDLRSALEAHGWNKTHAAKALGIAVNTLKKRMALLGVTAPAP